MPIFACENCTYTTTTKQLIRKHINKKNPCSKQIVFISKNTIEKLNDMEQLKIDIDDEKELDYYDKAIERLSKKEATD